MNSNIILVVLGEPNSTFTEVLFKYFKSPSFKRNKNNIILIGSKKLVTKQMEKLNYSFFINEINNIKDSSNKIINLINVEYIFKKTFSEINSASNRYIGQCFNLALKLIKLNNINKLINGPISKKHFLKKKFPGITEYIGAKTGTSDPIMLIYNKNLSVCPLTTHIPIKDVTKYVKKEKIINAVKKLNKFYNLKLKKKPRIALLGLNPHCESISKISEEKKEIIPAIKYLEKAKIQISGPFSADTFFLKKNIEKFDVVMGMYHDQVLTPIKTLFKFKAINVTVGLPFIKVTPDHGPNFEMVGMNKSDPSSIFCAFDFFNKLQ
ncbi:4-hydroxythreonine-4-phosphate dehydrogenase PdxA [Pelagibacterales bacterium SAG-MED23]|nr:4-hydroxythreonine-4-phosphate dehydrogenase PdxA [Pelagibacterales bacterium SAG-MED23]